MAIIQHPSQAFRSSSSLDESSWNLPQHDLDVPQIDDHNNVNNNDNDDDGSTNDFHLLSTRSMMFQELDLLSSDVSSHSSGDDSMSSFDDHDDDDAEEIICCKDFENEEDKGSRSKVSFSTVCIRRYNVVLGDHPCCSSGCPISFGWEYSAAHDECMPLNAYERKHRNNKRSSNNNLRTTSKQRFEMLIETGDYGETELRHACRRVNRRTRAAAQRAKYPRIKEDFFFAPPAVAAAGEGHNTQVSNTATATELAQRHCVRKLHRRERSTRTTANNQQHQFFQ